MTGRGGHGRSGGAGTTRDYVLAVGPGRSGTTFLYRRLIAHPAFSAPEIKEAHYYRSDRRLARARRRLGASGAILLDVADTAWSDRRLGRVAALVRRGERVLVVVMLRRHRDQARSVMAYRRSRVLPALPALLAGRRGLERAAVRDSLSSPALERIFALGADVLTIEFETLVRQPRAVLDALARLCGTAPFGRVDAEPVKPAERARFAPFAAAAKLAAVVLRAVGARRLLQALKDDPRIVRLFFRSARPDEMPVLGDAAIARLDRRHAACLATVEATSARLGDGLWLARGGRRRIRSRRSGPVLPGQSDTRDPEAVGAVDDGGGGDSANRVIF